MKPKCENCRFYKPENDSGECKRYSPRIVDGQIKSKFSTEATIRLAVFPEVFHDDWCGEFQEKGKEECEHVVISVE